MAIPCEVGNLCHVNARNRMDGCWQSWGISNTNAFADEGTRDESADGQWRRNYTVSEKASFKLVIHRMPTA